MKAGNVPTEGRAHSADVTTKQTCGAQLQVSTNLLFTRRPLETNPGPPAVTFALRIWRAVNREPI